MRFIAIVVLCLHGAFALAVEPATGPSDSDFAAEAESLENRLAQNGLDAATLYNLGNARYRLRDYGPAILAYERALLLDPRAPDIRANLRLARDAAAAFDETMPPPWVAPLYWLGFDEWLAVGALALVLLAVVSLTKGFGFPNRKARMLSVLSVVGIFTLFTSVVAVSLRHPEMNRAIVLSPNSAVRLSPFATAEIVATLNPGKPLHVKREHENFFLVENGWISKEDAALVFPER